MILIVSSLLDSHARVVVKVLVRRGVPVFIGDVMEFGAGAQLSLGADEARWVRADGCDADLNEATAIWCRRNFPPIFDSALRDPCDRDFVRKQWNELLWGTVCALDVPLFNHPFRQYAATKPLQLAIAREVGLRVPDTLISNDADAVLDFVERHRGRVIHKALGAATDRLLFTKRWDARDHAALDALTLAPTIFQQQIGGDRELRLTIAGERCFAAEFDAGGRADGRLDVDVPFRPHALPAEVEGRLALLMEALGLRYATVDLRIDEHGDYVFLELNPQGQFLYMEIKTGLPIADAVADLLCGPRTEAFRLDGVARGSGSGASASIGQALGAACGS